MPSNAAPADAYAAAIAPPAEVAQIAKYNELLGFDPAESLGAYEAATGAAKAPEPEITPPPPRPSANPSPEARPPR